MSPQTQKILGSSHDATRLLKRRREAAVCSAQASPQVYENEESARDGRKYHHEAHGRHNIIHNPIPYFSPPRFLPRLLL